jgi:phytoene dehydrogenase-like protein
MKYDVIVIGSGLSGLAAGIRLAMFDKRVLIVEKHTVVGGLNSYYTRKNRTIDVGLHAMTNYAPKGARSTPLGKLLKQLRLSHDDFRLHEQEMSAIRFPDKCLHFTNDFELFKQEISEQFPDQIDGFMALVKKIESFDELSLFTSEWTSSQDILKSYISNPILIDMLFCPLMYYGNASERDMDFYQFVIMFKSIFMEGFAKPLGGMLYILNLLVDKYRNLGGELRMGSEVESITSKNGIFKGLKLVSGDQLTADVLISSMGRVETLKCCDPPLELGSEDSVSTGQVSFMESLFALNQEPKNIGYPNSIVFFCTENQFRYEVPATLIDVSSGVLCCPNNFKYPEHLSEGMIRLTNLASFRLWNTLSRREYIDAKKEWRAKALENLFTFFPDFRDSVVFLDSFTPKTIYKYTGHLNGAVYGSSKKAKDGTTPIRNLFICGTDQGFLGIVGATLSGISMANLHVLQKKAQPNR